MAKVALISTNNRYLGVKEVVKLLNIESFKGKDVVIKPNFNTADPPPASTAIDSLKALIELLHEQKVETITVAERSGPADTEEVFQVKGLYELQKEHKFAIINLAESPLEEYVLVKPEKSLWKEGFLFAKVYQEAESIIELCCLKTHQYGGHITLSLKNAVGMVPRKVLDGNSYMKELHSSPHQRALIAEINTAFHPQLIIMDGVTAFVDGGPDKGTEKEVNVFLASTDRIAIDAVGIALLRILGTTSEVSKGPIFEQEQIKRAVELDLGIKSPTDIEIVANSKETEQLAEQIMEKLLER